MALKNRHIWWSKWRRDAPALLCILLFFTVFFFHVIFGNRVIIAGDALYYSYPLRTVAWNMIRAGELPLWTPYLLSGYPLLSMAQVATAYPLTWPYLLQLGYWAEQLYVLAPFLLSPMFTYAYIRELGRSRHAALLAGLAFGYGGMMASFIANSGMLTNSLLWAPLVLIFIDRARTRSLAYCLPRATAAYTLAVLAGHAQSYTYVGVLVLAYGLFLTLWQLTKDSVPGSYWARWRPLATGIGMILFTGALASFQLLESLHAARRSIRSELSFEAFGEGSFALTEALLSIGAPLYHYVDTSAYVAPLAVVLALFAVICSFRKRGAGDPRLWFWSIVTVLAFLLLLGSHTPIHHLLYYVPVLNQFRVPSRHTFEFTFAVSVLAAYGWDAVADYFERRRELAKPTTYFHFSITLSLLVLAIVAAWLWWRATSTPPVPNPSIYTGLPETYYWLWKLLFTILIFSLIWWTLRLRRARSRAAFLATGLMLACFAEPYATVSCWWSGLLSLNAERLNLVSPTTKYLQELQASENRVYTRAGLFSEEFRQQPRLEAPNLHALYGLHNVAGMEPLILQRYSRALGGVGPDSVTPRPGFPSNDDLFSARSRVLDLLNTTHVVSFTNLKTFEDPLTYRDGIGLSVLDHDANLPAGAKLLLTGSKAPVDQLALVTSLSNSVVEAQGTEVARVRLRDEAGTVSELSLRAGIETSEWAHARDDVRSAIKHEMAPVFESRPADAANSFSAQRYWARLSFQPKIIAQVEIENVSKTATLAVWRASLYASDTGISTALSPATRSEFWKTVYDEDGVQILRNERALPRAWLVAKAEAVNGEEALQRIRGQSGHQFDPLSTALLEVTPDELPILPGGELSPKGNVSIVSYSPNRLTLTTEAPVPTVLVVGEIFYPGWEVKIDGQPARLLLTNYLLRGVAVPGGKHRVEMWYTAPAARNGVMISLSTLLILGLFSIYGQRIHQRLIRSVRTPPTEGQR